MTEKRFERKLIWQNLMQEHRSASRALYILGIRGTKRDSKTRVTHGFVVEREGAFRQRIPLCSANQPERAAMVEVSLDTESTLGSSLGFVGEGCRVT
jgi:hypothetical protein